MNLDDSLRKKGTVPICAQHPSGRSGKWGLSPFSPDDSLRVLLDAACCDELTDEQFDRLETALASSDEARRAYLRYFTLTGELRYLVSMGHADEAARERTGTAGAVAGNFADAPPGLPCAPLPDAPLSFATFHGPAEGMSLDWTRAYLMAAAVLGLFLLVASFIHVTPDASRDYGSTLANNNSRGLTAPGLSNPQRPESVFVGRVTNMKDCRWSDPATETYAGAYVTLGRKYALASGLMEITYRSGAKVILEGPCRYEVESTAGGFLALGKLTARVEQRSEVRGQKTEDGGLAASAASMQPQAAKPQVPSPKPQALRPKTEISKSPNLQISKSLFTVRTPTAVVTDLGTEFGVEVDRQGITNVCVFVGSISLRATPAEGGENESRVMHAGQAATVGTGKSAVSVANAERAELDGKRFVRAMPKTNAALDSSEYADLVLSMQPAVYYRMAVPNSDRDRLSLFDSAPGGHHGELRFSGEHEQPYRPGRFGKSLHLRGPTVRYMNDIRPPSNGDFATVPHYPDAKSGRISLSAWVMAESRTQWAMIACNSSAASEWYFDFGLRENDGDLGATSSRRNGKRVMAREGASRPFPLNQWQHVAMVCDSSGLRLYRNGIEVASAPPDEAVPEPEVQCLSIGSKAEHQNGELVPYYCWQGRIDELAVFNRALSAAEVRQLAGVADRRVGENRDQERGGEDNK